MKWTKRFAVILAAVCCLCGCTDARRAVPCRLPAGIPGTAAHRAGPDDGLRGWVRRILRKKHGSRPGADRPWPAVPRQLWNPGSGPARHCRPPSLPPWCTSRKCSAVIPPRCRLAATGTDYSHAPRSKARRCCRMQGIVLTPPSFLLTLGHSCEHRRLWAAMAGGHHAYPFLLTHAPDSRGEICAFRHVCRKRMVLAAPRQRKTFPGDAFEVRCCPASPACRFPAPFLDNVSRYAPGACCRGPVPHTRTPSSAGVPGPRRRARRVSRCFCNSPHFPYERSS